jgi:hypothetical protein
MDGIIYKVKDVLVSPHYFFRGVKREKGITSALTYFVLLSLVGIILSWISYTYLIIPLLKNYTTGSVFGIYINEMLARPTLLSFVSGFIATIAFSFVIAGIIHLWCLLFGGTGNYGQSYKLYAYSATPKLLFGWIPIVGWLSGIYSLVLLIIGTQRLHMISRTRAIMMYVIPYAILVMLGIVIVLMVFVIFKNIYL